MATALAAKPLDDETVRIDAQDPGATRPLDVAAVVGQARVLTTPSVSAPARSRAARRWVAAGLGLLAVAAVGIGVAVTRDDAAQPDTTLPLTTPTVVSSQAPSSTPTTAPATAPATTAPAVAPPAKPGPKGADGPKGKTKDVPKRKGAGQSD
jgi:hypothetical protein